MSLVHRSIHPVQSPNSKTNEHRKTQIGVKVTQGVPVFDSKRQGSGLGLEFRNAVYS